MLTNHFPFTCMLLAASFLAGCAEEKSNPPETAFSSPSNFITDASVTEVYQVKFVTSKGEFVVEVHPEWAPIAATHFHKLVDAKFYDDCYFFRVIDNFMAQTGMNGDPQVNRQWSDKNLQDEEVKQKNVRGMVTFGRSGLPNSRSTHIFVNYGTNSHLDTTGFPPFGKVISGMDVVASFYSGYDSRVINQDAIAFQGNDYLKKNFPKLDRIVTARIIKKAKKTEKKKEPQK